LQVIQLLDIQFLKIIKIPRPNTR